MRLINADELKKVIHSSSLSGNREWLLMDLDQIIDNAPTVDDRSLEIAQKSIELGRVRGLIEGKLKRPKGEWIVAYRSCGTTFYTCSNCKEGKAVTEGDTYYSLDEFNFCPNCGASMKKGKEE